MALSPSDLTTYRSRLAEAQTALHQIMVGGGVVRVRDQSGEEIVYSTANASRLRAYIAELKALIADVTPVAGPMRTRYL